MKSFLIFLILIGIHQSLLANDVIATSRIDVSEVIRPSQLVQYSIAFPINDFGNTASMFE
jgi:hypothetical protein